MNKRLFAIYARTASKAISRTVAEQVAMCAEAVRQQGGSVIGTYSDSAAGTAKGAPGFREMLSKIETGTIDAVMCVSLDRISRRYEDFDEVIALVRDRRIPLFTVDGGQVDELHILVSGLATRTVSEQYSVRVRRGMVKARSSGR